MAKPRKPKPEVQRQDVPPKEDTRYIPIVSAQCGTTLHFNVVNPSLTGLWTHYYLDRTIPCMGRESGCICRSVRLAKRWKGYLGCWWPLCARLALVEITIEAHRNNPKLFEGRDEMRGLSIGLFRLTHNKRGPVRVYLEGRVTSAEMEALPPPFDAMRCLYALWGFNPDEYIAKRVAQMKRDAQVDQL